MRADEHARERRLVAEPRTQRHVAQRLTRLPHELHRGIETSAQHIGRQRHAGADMERARKLTGTQTDDRCDLRQPDDVGVSCTNRAAGAFEFGRTEFSNLSASNLGEHFLELLDRDDETPGTTRYLRR